MTNTPGTITVTMVDGTQVVVPNSLEEMSSYVLQEQGDWFEDEIKFLRRLVQPGQTVVGIGANVGVYALTLARKVGPTGQVWAFEPASDTAALLAESITANATSWLQLERQALSDHAGSAWLQTPGQSKLNSLAVDQKGPGEEVSLTTLDACLEKYSWQKVDLLKIDAEGEEERILAGGQKFFSELSPLVMFKLKAADEIRFELVEQFKGIGYGCYRLVPGLDVLRPFDPADGVDGYLFHLFAAKPGRALELAARAWLVHTANPTPPDLEDCELCNWRERIMQLPRAEASATIPERKASPQPRNSFKPLALWAYAKDQSQPIEPRLGALLLGYRLLKESSTESGSPSYWANRTRFAIELGERQQALQAVGNLLPILQSGSDLEPNEPFLPPNPHYDQIDPAGRLPDWLESAAWETEELFIHPSSYFNWQTSLPRLERIQLLGFARDWAADRLRLIRRRFPPRSKADPSLEKPNAEQIVYSREAYRYTREGDIEASRDTLAKAFRLGDRCSESLLFIARTLQARGEKHRAIDLLQRAVELNPQKPTTLLELALALKCIGKHAEAHAVANQVILLYSFMAATGPITAADLSNMAIAHDEAGEEGKALALLDEAIKLDPQFENALRRKASILARSAAGHAEALGIWKHLLRSKNTDVGIMTRIAGILNTYGELTDAKNLLKKAHSLAPDYAPLYPILLWNTSISGAKSSSDHLSYARQYWKLFGSSESNLPTGSEPTYSVPPQQEKLRIGILSAEVGNHVVGSFLEPFLRNYNRNKIHLEVIQAREHGSSFASFLRAKVDAVLSIEKLGVDEARRRIRGRGYHLIVETSGFTANNAIHLLASRCALVQCHYIGFHASTGLQTIDWFIGDDLTAAPEFSGQFVEKLWRLPRPWLARQPGATLPSAESLSTGKSPILGSFSQFGKIGEETLEFWACALRQNPEALLHIKSFTTNSKQPRQRILARLRNLGVEAERITFLEPSPSSISSLEKYRQIDVALDTTPWSGATTCFDALSMGVPVAAIRGGATASRMSSSILRAIEHDDWCAQTPETFAEIVKMFCHDLQDLRRSRNSLRNQVLASSLYDGEDLAKHLENAFMAMVHQKYTKIIK